MWVYRAKFGVLKSSSFLLDHHFSGGDLVRSLNFRHTHVPQIGSSLNMIVKLSKSSSRYVVERVGLKESILRTIKSIYQPNPAMLCLIFDTGSGHEDNPPFDVLYLSCIYIYMGVAKNRGTPKSSILNRVFHYKPSILVYPYFWKHPYIHI